MKKTCAGWQGHSSTQALICLSFTRVNAKSRKFLNRKVLKFFTWVTSEPWSKVLHSLRGIRAKSLVSHRSVHDDKADIQYVKHKFSHGETSCIVSLFWSNCGSLVLSLTVNFGEIFFLDFACHFRSQESRLATLSLRLSKSSIFYHNCFTLTAIWTCATWLICLTWLI